MIDKASANDETIAKSLREAKLIYLLGGFLHYLGQTLKNSVAWKACLEAFENGAVIAGSSAGAMVMCGILLRSVRRESSRRIRSGEQFARPAASNTFGNGWASSLLKQIPSVTLIGIDEQTGMLKDGEHGMWNVYGAGEATLYRKGRVKMYKVGNTFSV
ncbi:MAG: Type 1 glutamine amidotransferase-like domain-containing protein [Anaerolineales bacterium]